MTEVLLDVRKIKNARQRGGTFLPGHFLQQGLKITYLANTRLRGNEDWKPGNLIQSETSYKFALDLVRIRYRQRPNNASVQKYMFKLQSI